ncbi:MAG: NUDIX domain-containing protein [Actinomycetota bacterium]|nr:MAG: NUDIX domain-containing protein [Actinomycetota bacterium]
MARWHTADPAQSRLRSDFVDFLDAHQDGLQRECLAGHLTASVLVADSTVESVLLTLHPKVGRWLQLGGHIEPGDVDLRAAAAREALEESGIDGLTLSAEPLHLDRHRVRCRPDVVLDHWDVQYVALAPAGARAVRSAESTELAWFTWNQLPERTDDAVRALVAAARSLRPGP